MTTLTELENHDGFIERHIGPSNADIDAMLATIGAQSLDHLVAQTVPASILLEQDIPLPAPRAEHEALAELKALAQQNRLSKTFIGMGYADTLTPAVILRNVMENPGWYTAYTPYQAEIAQGRLEALLNYQQVIIDMTGLPLANASLLDEATAAAEAMTMARRVSTSKSNRFFVDSQIWPQTLDVLKTRAEPFGFELVLGEPADAAGAEVFGALFQYPNARGEAHDLSAAIAARQGAGRRGRAGCRFAGAGAAEVAG